MEQKGNDYNPGVISKHNKGKLSGRKNRDRITSS